MKNEVNRKKDSHGQDRPRPQGSNRRDRRARTRPQLIEAARALYALNPIEAVTVDNLVGEAVAKGTFYVHFDGLAELQAAVADQLAHEFDELFSLAGWRPRTRSSELLRAAGRSSARRSAILPGARSWPAASYPCRTSRLARGRLIEGLA
jgi:AcrR family transcriptional regulator